MINKQLWVNFWSLIIFCYLMHLLGQLFPNIMVYIYSSLLCWNKIFESLLVPNTHLFDSDFKISHEIF